MQTIAALLLASAAYITPTYEGDFNNFIRLLWANERCPGVVMNVVKTLEQIRDLGEGVLDLAPETVSDRLLVGTRLAQAEYQLNRGDFCVSARKLYYSYDPAHLRKVGVID